MSDQKLVLMRLRAAVGTPARWDRRRGLRLAVLAAVLAASALSVGWWVYSRTTDQDLYLRAERLWRATRYREAVALYEHLFTGSTKGDLAENALFDAATLYYYNLADVPRSIDLYNRLISTYPNGRHVREACLRLGQIYASNLGDLRAAIRQWEEGIKLRPGVEGVMPTEQYLDVLSRIADGYFNLDEFDTALETYQRIADGYPSTHKAAQANLRIGMILQMRRLYRPSIKPLQTVAEDSSCADCRFMAQTALIEAYENLEDLDTALQIVEKLTPPPGQADYPKKERQRLRRLQQQLARSVASHTRR